MATMTDGAPPHEDLTAADLVGAGFLGAKDFTQRPDALGALWDDLPKLSAPCRTWLDERFEILGALGAGGMWTVLHARERSSAREVAVKVMDCVSSSRQRERFLREGVLTAALNHPGIVGVHGTYVDGDACFMVCELVPGAQTLDNAFLATPDLRDRVAMVLDAARALGHAHRKGVVHRDVKPTNVLVDDAGRVRVIDLGIAFVRSLDRLTRSGEIVGTPLYAAPEQIASERESVGTHTDVWGLGSVLYQALTGELPFQGDTLAQLGGQICSAEPTPPRELCPEVSKALERVCLKALRRKPVDRYPDGEAFARAIESALAAREGVQVWLPLLGGVVALVFGIGIPVAALLSSPDPATAALPVGRTLPAEPLTPADPPLRGPDVEPVEPVKAVVPPDLESSLAEHTQWFEQAMQLSSEGNDAAAIDAYTRALEVRVTPRALVERGLCRMRGGDAAAAIVDYKRALELYGPNDLARRVAAGHLRTAVRQQDRLNRGEEQ